nr:MAG TPA: hypothetical protein [Caudoviricetes sp.]
MMKKRKSRSVKAAAFSWASTRRTKEKHGCFLCVNKFRENL